MGESYKTDMEERNMVKESLMKDFKKGDIVVVHSTAGLLIGIFLTFFGVNAIPIIHGRALLVSMPLLALFSILFCREFLQTKQHSLKLDLALRAMLCFEVFNFFSALFFSWRFSPLI